MKRSKRSPRATLGESTNSNELDEQNNASAKVTGTPEGTADAVAAAADKSYHDQIDHCQEEQQQVGLLASELTEGERDTRRITTRLSALVPNIMVKSHHQKAFDSNSGPAETRNATTAARAMKKMLREGDNNSGRQSGVNADLESNGKTTKRSCSKTSCCVVLLMAITIIVTLLLFFLHKPTLVDDGSRCLNQDVPHQNYKLFSTKTLYNTALHYIDQSVQPASLPQQSVNSDHQHHNHNQDYYDKSSISVPDILKPKSSLQAIHNNLTSQNCTLKQFYFIGRHAARLPSEDDINDVNKYIKNIISRIDLSKFKTEPAPQDDQPATSPKSSPDVVAAKTGNGPEKVCRDPLFQIGTWNNYVSPDQGNLVTEAGFHESEQLAQRLKNIFPELFDGSKTDIKFGTTEALRTAQTAISFLKHMVNHHEDCSFEQFAAVDTKDKAKAEKIINDACSKDFIKKHNLEILKFHKTCKELEKNHGTIMNVDIGLSDTDKIEFISKSVSKKLKLTGDKVLTSKETKAVYDMCRYESAQLGETSIWCHYFEVSELKFLEYMADVMDFHTDAYGFAENYRSSCKIADDILKSFSSYKKRNDKVKPQANFYFTHSAAIQRIVAASLDLAEDPAYTTPNIKNHFHDGTAPERKWRTSLLSPFSANIAFSLYDCPASLETKSPAPVDDGTQDFVVTPLKVVTSLNEQPIILDGCKDYICNFNEMKHNTTLFNGADKCSLEKICKRPIKLV